MAEVELDTAEPVAHLRAGGKLLAALRGGGLAVTARQSRDFDLADLGARVRGGLATYE